jgi:Tol biopolymer transport system component
MALVPASSRARTEGDEMKAYTHKKASRTVLLLMAAAVSTVAACGDDDASETATTAGQASLPAVTADESTVTGSTTDGLDTTTPSPTVGDVEPWIVYSAGTPTGAPEGVFLVHSDGSDEHQILTELPDIPLSPDWSPDGTRLAVQIFSLESVWVSNADGSEPEMVLECTGLCAVLNPAWSPSGEQLLTVRWDDTDPSNRTTVPEDMPSTATVELLDLRTGERRDILQSAYPELLRAPSWSPDGSSYVVTVERFDQDGTQTGSAIAIGGLDGSPLRFLTEFEEWAAFADWHPRDDVLAYGASTPSSPASADQASNLFTIRADGTDRNAVTAFEPGGSRAAGPHWTPDGERILFTQIDDPADADASGLYSAMASVKPDGTELERLPLAGRNGDSYTMQPTPE